MPQDALQWSKLEEFRKVLLRLVDGEQVLELPDASTAQALAHTDRVKVTRPPEAGAGACTSEFRIGARPSLFIVRAEQGERGRGP